MTVSTQSIAARARPGGRILIVVGLLAFGFVLRDHLFAAGLFALANLWQMAPIVLIGLLVTATLTATGSIGLLVAPFDARETLAAFHSAAVRRMSHYSH